ncbi:MAG: hypothetical protein KatS3mg087_0498 [Patescibacteria group bacterium]|nr:MAG: hypothetical protein KatS3mg087_0498 [Patescibacteria group bacterium]
MSGGEPPRHPPTKVHVAGHTTCHADPSLLPAGWVHHRQGNRSAPTRRPYPAGLPGRDYMFREIAGSNNVGSSGRSVHLVLQEDKDIERLRRMLRSTFVCQRIDDFSIANLRVLFPYHIRAPESPPSLNSLGG